METLEEIEWALATKCLTCEGSGTDAKYTFSRCVSCWGTGRDTSVLTNVQYSQLRTLSYAHVNKTHGKLPLKLLWISKT